MTPSIFDGRTLTLGEGPLWHPERAELFWFDIPAGRLLSREGEWTFGAPASAAAWVDRETLLVARKGALLRLDLATGATEPVASLGADDPRLRSNDGRADPWGGFWIGTMGEGKEPGIGAIHRYFRGELRRVFAPVTIPNAIAFAPGGGWMTFADTPRRLVWRQRLAEADGWPVGDPEVFLDLRAEGLNPDGAVFDAEGALWIAFWGAGRVERRGSDGARLDALALPVSQPSCPAFGGENLRTLFATTAREDLDANALAAEPAAGAVFAAPAPVRGLPEPRAIL